MSSIQMKRDITDPFVAWLKVLFPGTPVIVMRPNAPRPNETYLAVQVTTPLQFVGYSDHIEHVSETTFNIGGQRTFGISVSAYVVKNESNRNVHTDFFDAQDLLIQLQDHIEDPSKIELLEADGLAVWDTGDILDLTAIIETGFESRAQIDLLMGIASNRQVSLGAIESVEYEGTVDGESESGTVP